MGKNIFILLAALFVQATLVGCSKGCDPKLKDALSKFMEAPIGSESAEKQRQEMAVLMDQCGVPDRGIEIPGLGIYKKHHFAIVTANKELLEDLVKGKGKLDDSGLPSKTNSMHLAAVF